MSFNVTWPVRWPTLDVERFTAAVKAELALLASDLEATISDNGDSLSCSVEMPSRFVAQWQVPGGDEPLPRDDAFIGIITLSVVDDHPLMANAPYEVLHSALTDEEYDQPIGGVEALCTIGRRVHAVTASGACFVRDGTWWQLERDDWDDFKVRGVGNVGGLARYAGAAVFADKMGRLVKLPTPDDELDLIAIAGETAPTAPTTVPMEMASPAWVIGDHLHHFDGATWAVVELDGEDGPGWPIGFVPTARGLFLSTSAHPLLALANGRVTPIDCTPIAGAIGQPEAITATADGRVWVASTGSAAAWDGTRWRESTTNVGHVRALVGDGDAVVVLGRDDCARWDGERWSPIEVDLQLRSIRCATLGPNREILIGVDDGVVTLVPRGPYCILGVESNDVDNREAWGGICEVASRIAERLGAAR